MKKISQEEQQLVQKLVKFADDRMPPIDLADKIMAEVDERNTCPFYIRCIRWFRLLAIWQIQPAAVFASAILVAVAFYGGMQFQQKEDLQAARLEPQADQSADSMFLIGRGLIAGGQYRQALCFFNRANSLDPARAEFAYWQGIAYGMVGEVVKERTSYRRSLSFRPDFYQANLNLGHSYLENREFDAALQQYQLVLKKNEGNLQALYNQALIYREIGDQQREKEAYYQYLQWSRSGKWAKRAALHLNRLGDFRYRVFTIGITDMVIDTSGLLQPMGEVTELEIDRILSFIPTAAIALHLVVFKEGDLQGAKETAIRLREQFLAQKDVQQEVDVKASWFDVADQHPGKNSGRKPEALKDSILIFTQSVQQSEAERNRI